MADYRVVAKWDLDDRTITQGSCGRQDAKL